MPTITQEFSSGQTTLGIFRNEKRGMTCTYKFTVNFSAYYSKALVNMQHHDSLLL